MIGITRPSVTPDVLLTRGVAERLTCRGTVKSEIYAHESVRRALDAAHHSKCCYCESILSLDVEHFRPKSHYYWLAYEWSNLLLACRKCNELKGTHFPIEDEAQRASSHADDVTRERPLFLDPTVDAPEEHIEWVDETARGKTARGQEMARRLLNRTALVKARWEWLRTVRRLINILQTGDAISAREAQEALDDLCSNNASFSAMVRAYVDRLKPSAI